MLLLTCVAIFAVSHVSIQVWVSFLSSLPLYSLSRSLSLSNSHTFSNLICYSTFLFQDKLFYSQIWRWKGTRSMGTLLVLHEICRCISLESFSRELGINSLLFSTYVAIFFLVFHLWFLSMFLMMLPSPARS